MSDRCRHCGKADHRPDCRFYEQPFHWLYTQPDRRTDMEYPRALVRRTDSENWKVHLLRTPVEKPGSDNVMAHIYSPHQRISELSYQVIADIVAVARETPDPTEPPC